jgi:hypothetical protein
MAAVAYTKQRSANWNSAGQGRVFIMVPSNSYPAGGEVIANTDVGLSGPIDMILFGPALSSTFALLAAYDPTTAKVRFFYPSGGATAAPATPAAPLITAGGTAVTGSTAAGPFTPGGGKEVPTGADLSAVTVYGVAFGAY